jgi:predicted RNA-binding protein
MSRSKNIKRGKLLRRKKIEREQQMNLNVQLEKDKKKLQENAEKDGLIIMDRAELDSKEKVSSLLLEMIKPLLSEASDEEEAKTIIAMGIVAWNSGIIKENQGTRCSKK